MTRTLQDRKLRTYELSHTGQHPSRSNLICHEVEYKAGGLALYVYYQGRNERFLLLFVPYDRVVAFREIHSDDTDKEASA